jgi:hypothetical protein
MATILSTDVLDVRMTASGDLFVGPLGTSFVSGTEAIAQLLRIAVRLFTNEWFLNLDAGVNWDAILGEKYNEQLIRESLTPVILASPGVAAINSLAISLNDTTRQVSISYSVQAVFGDTVADTLAVH